ncbi:MAG: hypothetical protein QNJ05_03175 [Woeseiaceae bacterium]|nr:hypothetical protein [Woeseiaceae bacterium]
MSDPHLDRFDAAVRILAGDGNVKDRLLRAFEENLSAIPDEELPTSLKDEFTSLKSRMTCVEPHSGEGAICASVRKMSAKEASRCAVSVVSIYGEMLRSRDARTSLLTVDQDDASVVPPFLVKSVS